MPIQEGNIKLLASQVMDDVPEGGGSATGNVITDGSSNAIFPDVSELDRAYGRVSLRKMFAGVHTPSVDGYYGANVILADNPDDANVTCTLFTTKDHFDERTAAAAMVEAYLFKGPAWSGYLFGDHIAGMRAISLLQRLNTTLPVVGQTFILQDSTHSQYVRVIGVASQNREFTEAGYTFSRQVVTLEISDALRYDFTGKTATYNDPTSFTTTVYDTLVADTTRYFGTSKLTATASTGAADVEVQSIYSKLVPSAQIEVPATDQRANVDAMIYQQSSQAMSMVNYAIGQGSTVNRPVLPGSMSITVGGNTYYDSNGKAMLNGVEVGTVDYALGKMVVAGINNTGTMSYKLAASPEVVMEAMTIPVTLENRSLSVALTLNPLPAKGSLQVHYMVGGNWYVLKDQGTGALKGTDSAYGAGVLNYQTGGLAVTMGALPDVGSAIMLYWGDGATKAVMLDTSQTPKVGYKAVLGQPIVPSTLTFNGYGEAFTCNSAGVLTGGLGGTGTVLDASNGTIVVYPHNATNSLTSVAFSTGTAESPADVISFTSSGSTWTTALGGPVVAGSFSAEIYFDAGLGTEKRQIADNGSGSVVLLGKDSGGNDTSLTIGTINYTNGQIVINKMTTSSYTQWRSRLHYVDYLTGSDYYTENNGALTGGIKALGAASHVSVEWYPVSVTSTTYTVHGGDSSQHAMSSTHFLSGVGSTVNIATYTLTSRRFFLKKSKNASIVKKSVVFNFDSVVPYYDDGFGNITTGGSNLGTIDYTSGEVALTGAELANGASVLPAVTVLAGLVQPGVAQITDTAFRTPLAPVRPGWLTVAAQRTSDGVTLTASADSSGIINTDNVVGVVNFQTGVTRVWFGTKTNPGGHTKFDLSAFVPGVTEFYLAPVVASTVRFSSVGYTYTPLDADLLGLDPVRLPTDGRVPIYRKGDVAVVHNTQSTSPQTVTNGTTVNCGRTRLSRVRVVGNNGGTITTGYAANLDAGTVTFSDVTGYSQPIHVEHRIEDMAMLGDVQISGALSFTRPLTHDFPADTSWVSSALIFGDLKARVSALFDQGTWGGVWQDTVNGSAASASYNDAIYPAVVTNDGAITERWVLQFTNTTTFNLIGEHVGQIATGVSIAADFAPINPATSQPYFTLHKDGWGSGWSAGNCLRINTVGALAPFWIARTVAQGEATATSDSFTLLLRGDIDTP